MGSVTVIKYTSLSVSFALSLSSSREKYTCLKSEYDGQFTRKWASSSMEPSLHRRHVLSFTGMTGRRYLPSSTARGNVPNRNLASADRCLKFSGRFKYCSHPMSCLNLTYVLSLGDCVISLHQVWRDIDCLCDLTSETMYLLDTVLM